MLSAHFLHVPVYSAGTNVKISIFFRTKKWYTTNPSYSALLNYHVSCRVLYLLREFTTNIAGCECLIDSFSGKEKVSISIKFFFKICVANVPQQRTGVARKTNICHGS